MFKNWTQNYDPENHEEYLIQDTPSLLPHNVLYRPSHVQTIKILRVASRNCFFSRITLQSHCHRLMM